MRANKNREENLLRVFLEPSQNPVFAFEDDEVNSYNAIRKKQQEMEATI